MSDQPAAQPDRPGYLTAPWPAHFRLRTDLVEELCLPDAYARTLPKTPEEYAPWIVRWGITAKEVPFEPIRSALGSPYALTPRYVLRPTILPGGAAIQNVATDGRGWSVCCELGGLYDFVINRAAEFVAAIGREAAQARADFYPKVEKNPGLKSSYGKWAIGYEYATGLGTILWPEQSETVALYLAGQGGYLVPNFEETAPPS